MLHAHYPNLPLKYTYAHPPTYQPPMHPPLFFMPRGGRAGSNGKGSISGSGWVVGATPPGRGDLGVLCVLVEGAELWVSEG
jgi:hypothetical protein